MTKPKLIYISRATCEPCGLDKMISYYRIPNATPTQMHNGHKKALRLRFKEKYGCAHKVYFEREIAKDYLWNPDTNSVIKREGL